MAIDADVASHIPIQPIHPITEYRPMTSDGRRPSSKRPSVLLPTAEPIMRADTTIDACPKVRPTASSWAGTCWLMPDAICSNTMERSSNPNAR